MFRACFGTPRGAKKCEQNAKKIFFELATPAAGHPTVLIRTSHAGAPHPSHLYCYLNKQRTCRHGTIPFTLYSFTPKSRLILLLQYVLFHQFCARPQWSGSQEVPKKSDFWPRGSSQLLPTGPLKKGSRERNKTKKNVFFTRKTSQLPPTVAKKRRFRERLKKYRSVEYYKARPIAERKQSDFYTPHPYS